MITRHVATVTLLALAISSVASAAPNVTNATQKGSLLVWPVISLPAGGFGTLVRLQNDGSQAVDVKCYWMDANKNRVDFIIPLTSNQAVWFDAATGNGTHQVNPFPSTPANGFDNPFLDPVSTPGPGPGGPRRAGMLTCWAIDGGAMNQVKWNHLSGTATLYGAQGAFEYNAYAFFAPTGVDLQPVGVAGTLNLNGVEYDSCPLYQIGQLTPNGQVAPAGALAVVVTQLAVSGCTLDLRQDWAPVFTKLQFDVWNQDEIKFTGAYECADSWHLVNFETGNTVLLGGTLSVSTNGLDAAAQNFDAATLGTYAARYRAQGVRSSQCEKPATTGATDAYRPAIATQAVGLLGVQLTALNQHYLGTTLAGAGKATGKISWDSSAVVPESGRQ